MPEQKSSPPGTQCRVRFPGEREIGKRLVAANIQHPDDDFPLAQMLCGCAVELVLFLFRREMILHEKQELCAVESDTVGIHVRCRRGVRRLADVSAQSNLDAVRGD